MALEWIMTAYGTTDTPTGVLTVIVGQAVMVEGAATAVRVLTCRGLLRLLVFLSLA